MFRITKIYQNVIIVGNGFDLNLGLKTSYKDFVSSQQFRRLVKQRNDLCGHLQQQHNLQNWIDIENELKNYSKREATNFQKEFIALSNGLKEYLSLIDYSLINKNSDAFLLLEKYFKEDTIILDFNYTSSISSLLVTFGAKPQDIISRHIKMHGSLAEGEIVFGIEDAPSVKSEHVFLKKSYNASFKAVNLNSVFNHMSDLYIFGHSLGQTDHMYFSHFFNAYSNHNFQSKGKNIHLYYHGDDGYTQLFMQLDKLTLHRLTNLRQNNHCTLTNTLKAQIKERESALAERN